MRDDFIRSLQLFDYENEGWDEGSGKPAVLRDGRLSPVYHTDFNYTPVLYSSLEEWENRKGELREQILISAGLWPMPEKCALNARLFDRTAFDGFTVDKVMFESYPGFYVTGNLYRPLNGPGPFPAILNPHGHWANGRLEHAELSDIPTRCANFAKMGFVAFAYDMLGYLDSRQVNHLYGGTAQELWCSGAFGVQLWNSIRCIDFLESLAEVDAARIGCTGASGGGTQTFFLAAVDERIKAAAPVNMISAHMQGGCNCEEAPGLRINTNNVEIAAMIAPRPMLMIGSTGDWTKNTPTVEYPAIHAVYDLYGSGGRLEYFFQDAGHNYNNKARAAAYNWFAQKLQGKEVVWNERQVDFGDVNRFRIFAQDEKPGGIKSNAELFALQKNERRHAIDLLWQRDETAAAAQLKTAMRRLLGVSESASTAIAEKYSENVALENVFIRKLIVGTTGKREELPVVMANRNALAGKQSGKAVLFLHPSGKKALFEDEEWSPILENLLDLGHTVVSPDVFLTGEYQQPGRLSGRDTGRCNHFAAYNETDTALRVQDVITVCRYLSQTLQGGISLCGIGDAGLWCLAAMPFLGEVQRAVLCCRPLGLSDERDFLKQFFVPGFLAAGGFETCIRLSKTDALRFVGSASEAGAVI